MSEKRTAPESSVSAVRRAVFAVAKGDPGAGCTVTATFGTVRPCRVCVETTSAGGACASAMSITNHRQAHRMSPDRPREPVWRNNTDNYLTSKSGQNVAGSFVPRGFTSLVLHPKTTSEGEHC